MFDRDIWRPAFWGKIPSQADFVGYHAAEDEVVAFDQWLQKGLQAAFSQATADFQIIFVKSSALCFSLHLESLKKILLGVIRPSRDKGGRQYPFCILLSAAAKSMSQKALSYYPALFDPFFQFAVRLSAEAAAGMEVKEILRQVQENAVDFSDSNNPEKYGALAQAAEFNSFLAKSWNLHNGAAQQNFLELVAMTSQIRPPFCKRWTTAVQVPYGAGQSDDAEPAHLYFWSAFLHAMLRVEPHRTCLFWTGEENKSPSHRLYVFPDLPRPGSFQSLYMPDADDDYIYALKIMDEKTAMTWTAEMERIAARLKSACQVAEVINLIS